jgi:DNA-binding CsgD family transcriptional regulator
MNATAIAIPDESVTLLAPDEQRWAFEWSAYHRGLGGIGDSAVRWRGGLALALGDVDEARRLTLEAREWCEREGLVTELGRCEQQLAEIEHRRGRIPAAIELHTRALARFEEIGASSYAERSLSRLEKLKAIDPTVARLTARERQVIAALEAGGTNREIATALRVSHHTVANHVKSILNKTGLRNRAEAAAFAVAHGLAEGSP